MKKISIVTLVISLLIPLGTGMLSALLSNKGMILYRDMNKPPLSPPSWVFSVAWTVLYIMMGIAFYLILITKTDEKLKYMAIVVFLIQLGINFMWSIIFFNWKAYLLAFMWLLLLLCAVVATFMKFKEINTLSSKLLIPYILWLFFAAYLNLGTYLLNVPK